MGSSKERKLSIPAEETYLWSVNIFVNILSFAEFPENYHHDIPKKCCVNSLCEETHQHPRVKAILYGRNVKKPPFRWCEEWMAENDQKSFSYVFFFFFQTKKNIFILLSLTCNFGSFFQLTIWKQMTNFFFFIYMQVLFKNKENCMVPMYRLLGSLQYIAFFTQ